MPELIVCSRKDPFSEELKEALDEQGIPYREVDIRQPGVVQELKNRGCTALEPPVILISRGHRDLRFFTNDDLFWDGKLVREAVFDLARI
ncbi:MAG TPA: glutaredoxin domain-containing protein [Methanoregula sp.]|nr:glutaredoxin domain-containing protein [Methanoregula sp.]